MITFFSIAVPSFGAGVLVTTLFAMHVSQRRKDHFHQYAEETDAHGDVPRVER